MAEKKKEKKPKNMASGAKTVTTDNQASLSKER